MTTVVFQPVHLVSLSVLGQTSVYPCLPDVMDATTALIGQTRGTVLVSIHDCLLLT